MLQSTSRSHQAQAIHILLVLVARPTEMLAATPHLLSVRQQLQPMVDRGQRVERRPMATLTSVAVMGLLRVLKATASPEETHISAAGAVAEAILLALVPLVAVGLLELLEVVAVAAAMEQVVAMVHPVALV